VASKFIDSLLVPPSLTGLKIECKATLIIVKDLESLVIASVCFLCQSWGMEEGKCGLRV
jgi:hypothetical protein